MSITELSKTKVSIEDNETVYENHIKNTWEIAAFEDFVKTMSSTDNPFPCIFGVHGLKNNNLRYVFHEKININLLANQLKSYLKKSRSFGNNTSLVLFTDIKKNLALDEYFNIFWSTLKSLADIDEQPWPNEIPKDTSRKEWEFCFAGEPIFVVCNTPSHILRYSRHSQYFMITFQPRWVFDNILGTPAQADKAFSKVRAILKSYDITPVSPDLGIYGQEGVLESKQYFLDDINNPRTCPYKSLEENS
ncbi:YqcI/YcgG family protein [Marinobacter sp. 1Y8]